MRGEPILEIRDLRVGFKARDVGVFWAVDGLSFDVMKGSWTSLVGRSGSGKSVTAMTIGRLTAPAAVSGGIYWFGPGAQHTDMLYADLSTVQRIRGREIAYIFQDPGTSLNPVMTAGQQIDEVSRDRALTLATLSQLRIQDAERVYRSFPHELSGGMKQRVMIAAALCSGAKLIIADEPTTALDPTTETEIVDLLRSLQKDKKLTLLFITHQLTLARAVSDQVVVVDKGRVVPPDGPEARRLFHAELGDTPPKQRIEI